MAWIGVDFDGTLAKEYTLEPVIPMIRRIREWLADGIEVRIVTARATHKESIDQVKEWLKAHGLPNLEVTNKKDYQMVLLYDDRARQVITDTGEVVGE